MAISNLRLIKLYRVTVQIYGPFVKHMSNQGELPLARTASISKAYQQKGMYKESFLELERAREIDNDWTFLITEQATAYALMGRKPEAYRYLKELEQRSKKQFIDPGLFAMIYIALNEKDIAFEWLNRTVDEKSSWVIWLKLEPKFDPVRNEPRFAALLKKVGLSN